MDNFRLPELTPQYVGGKNIDVRITYTSEEGRRVSEDMRMSHGDFIDARNFGIPGRPVNVVKL